MDFEIKSTKAAIERAYNSVCAQYGLTFTKEQREEDISAALSLFFLKALSSKNGIRGKNAVAKYAVKQIIFRDNKKLNRERWSSEAELSSCDYIYDEEELGEQFPEAAEAVNTYSFKIFLKRLIRAGHDAAEVAGSSRALYTFFKKYKKI